MAIQKAKRMLVVELNAAEQYFLNKYVMEGQLPVFEKLLQAGKVIKTRVGSSAEQLKPWTIWPSIYTGLAPEQHGIVGFGQALPALQRQCIWDALNARGVSTGVFGSLMRRSTSQKSPFSLFYVPGFLAARYIGFPKSFSMIKAILSQMYLALIKRISYRKDRAILKTKCQMDIFKALYNQYKPQFSTLHLENIASAQHLYWRATEPEKFSDELSELDSYYFEDIEKRKAHEILFKDIILENFKLVDNFLGELLPTLDEETVLVIITGLGQKKRDPVHQIHKPEIRFSHLKPLLKKIGVLNCEILIQANPYITLNFVDTIDASLGAFKLSNLNVLGEYPLFKITQREHQLFLEENLPPTMWMLGSDVFIENKSNEMIFPLFDYVKISPLRDQHTADYSSEGWLLLYGNIAAFSEVQESIAVEEVYSLLLSYFNDKI